MQSLHVYLNLCGFRLGHLLNHRSSTTVACVVLTSFALIISQQFSCLLLPLSGGGIYCQRSFLIGCFPLSSQWWACNPGFPTIFRLWEKILIMWILTHLVGSVTKWPLGMGATTKWLPEQAEPITKCEGVRLWITLIITPQHLMQRLCLTRCLLRWIYCLDIFFFFFLHIVAFPLVTEWTFLFFRGSCCQKELSKNHHKQSDFQ